MKHVSDGDGEGRPGPPIIASAPRRVVAWRYITDWSTFPWVDGEPSPELVQALPGSGWHIERAYSE